MPTPAQSLLEDSQVRGRTLRQKHSDGSIAPPPKMAKETTWSALCVEFGPYRAKSGQVWSTPPPGLVNYSWARVGAGPTPVEITSTLTEASPRLARSRPRQAPNRPTHGRSRHNLIEVVAQLLGCLGRARPKYGATSPSRRCFRKRDFSRCPRCSMFAQNCPAQHGRRNSMGGGRWPTQHKIS